MKKILLIGDSIRETYDVFVKSAFRDVAEVYYPYENCRFTEYIVRQLDEWQDYLKCGEDIDLIHWNAGLWDSLILVDGKPLCNIEDYARNIERICKIMKLIFPKAKMIFATSTPVIEKAFDGRRVKRSNKDIERYNAVACEIVKKYGGEINDFYAMLKDCHEEYHSDQTHFYTRAGAKLFVNKIVPMIEKTLNIKAKEPIYDGNFPQFFIGL